jgi:hypothetical protein
MRAVVMQGGTTLRSLDVQCSVNSAPTAKRRQQPSRQTAERGGGDTDGINPHLESCRYAHLSIFLVCIRSALDKSNRGSTRRCIKTVARVQQSYSSKISLVNLA